MNDLVKRDPLDRPVFLADVVNMLLALSRFTPSKAQADIIGELWLEFVYPKVQDASHWRRAFERAVTEFDSFPVPAKMLELLRTTAKPRIKLPQTNADALNVIAANGWEREYQASPDYEAGQPMGWAWNKLSRDS